MLTNTPSHPVFLDAVKRLSDVQTYGASVTLLQQLTPPENTVVLINPSSHADLTFSCTSSVNNCTDQALMYNFNFLFEGVQ